MPTDIKQARDQSRRRRLDPASLLALLNPLTLFARRPTRLDDPAPQELIGRGVRFVERIYRMRMVGVATGLLCVGAGLVEQHAGWLAWTLLLMHALVWPQAARIWALRCRIPYRAERRNLVIDSVYAGFWVAAMHASLVPSAVIITMVSMDNIAAGGVRLFMRGLYANLTGFALGALVLGFDFAPHANLTTILASLPMLALYPLALGKTTYDMSRKLAERSRAFELVSQTDGLTGLFNRRYWENLLIWEFERCGKSDQPRHACLLLLDLDHFKSINDTHGHLVGDEVLRRFATLLRSNLREQDAIGRYGGEEFVVILRDTSASEAWQLTQRLVDEVRRYQVIPGGLRGCTVSAGLVPFDHGMEAHYVWLQRADHAMYRAKENGRDCVVAWHDDGAGGTWPAPDQRHPADAKKADTFGAATRPL
ncbi:diguanylate cyclase [Herbaspirillum sp. YR522]|uniref:diguanylate cyclase n=1 Tax=Herbaspirillum sp. YR522 TaxID=1144342 RepID=UPI00026F5C31|nr:diguanylate cyclase [Herbaspirillum sp. YR522]EJN09308.1 diguanylate cyclase (GGDEF) domain-containing protein [Herbaspirillum sp. YR522]